MPATVYFATVGDRSLKAQTGWANWFQDYPHPSNFIDTLLNPRRVVATGNNNYSYNAKDKELADKIDALSAEPELTDEVEKGWAERRPRDPGEGLLGDLRQPQADHVLLGAHGLRELQGRAPGRIRTTGRSSA